VITIAFRDASASSQTQSKHLHCNNTYPAPPGHMPASEIEHVHCASSPAFHAFPFAWFLGSLQLLAKFAPGICCRTPVQQCQRPARDARVCVHARAYACTQCPRAHPHASLPLSALTISDVPRMELARGAVETRSRVVFIRAGRAVKADDPGVAREDRGDCSELQRYDEPPGAPVVSSPGAAGRGPAGVRATASAAPHAPSASHFPPAPVCARGELHRERARAQARALWTHGHITGTCG